MKCVCGYEKLGKTHVKKVDHFKSGPKKGQVKREYSDYEDCDPENDYFYKVSIQHDLIVSAVRSDTNDSWNREYNVEIELYMCPKCNTIQGKF